jgi:hypothetical protein
MPSTHKPVGHILGSRHNTRSGERWTGSLIKVQRLSSEEAAGKCQPLLCASLMTGLSRVQPVTGTAGPICGHQPHCRHGPSMCPQVCGSQDSSHAWSSLPFLSCPCRKSRPCPFQHGPLLVRSPLLLLGQGHGYRPFWAEEGA